MSDISKAISLIEKASAILVNIDDPASELLTSAKSALFDATSRLDAYKWVSGLVKERFDE